jgi:hypothetical protein
MEDTPIERYAKLRLDIFLKLLYNKIIYWIGGNHEF